MGIFNRLRGTEGGTEAKYPAKSVLAAAMPLNGPGVKRVSRLQQRASQEEWQNQAWYYYDATGEARAPMVWIANAVSQADLYITELDPDTGKPTGPSDDPMAVAVAQKILGGPKQRARLLKQTALCWQVVGEAWTIVRPPARRGDPDSWQVLAGNKVRAKGETWQYTDPMTGETVTLGPNDLLMRVWSPHPEDQARADSSMRPGVVVCREIELASQAIAATLLSRIAMNGILLVADEMDMTGDTFMAQLLDTAEQGIKYPGDPSSRVPLAVNAPQEAIASGGAMAHIDLSTEFNGQLVDLRDNARTRLAGALDMPNDVAEGTQGEANHWSAWQVEESTYKIFIQPLLEAIGDAYSTYWVTPALTAMGMDPDRAARMAVGWDTTAVVARPDDTENLRDLHDRLLISDEYMLAENGIPEDAMPDEEERTRRIYQNAVMVAPTLLADPNVTGAMGLTTAVQPVAAGVDATVTPGGGLETPEPEPAANALPGTRGDRPQPDDVPEGLVAAAELIVYDALSRAGGRLLTNQNRGQFKAVPRHELYRSVPYGTGDIDRLMEGSFEFTANVAHTWQREPDQFRGALHTYVQSLLYRKLNHHPALLRAALK